jgi:hypothetical protein
VVVPRGCAMVMSWGWITQLGKGGDVATRCDTNFVRGRLVETVMLTEVASFWILSIFVCIFVLYASGQ